MKKLIVLFAVLASAFSCVSRQTADDLTNEKDSLSMVVAAKDSLLNDVFSSINLIAENLDAIKTREGIVTSNTSGELSKERRAQINEDVTAISELLAQNRATIERLKGSTEKLRRANVKIQELETLVANLTKQVADKDADIADLKDQLEKLHIQVTELNSTVDNLNSNVASLSDDKKNLESTVSDQTTALNTVYYIVGSEKELMDGGIIAKSGVIGRTAKMNSNYDLGKFTKVDKTGLNKIIVGKKRVSIISSHPAGSYELVMSDKNTCDAIVIKNPAKFWESSKVLVVSYK